jgi:alkylation response protein AidB-like acyl-CoA dehydrogenase
MAAAAAAAAAAAVERHTGRRQCDPDPPGYKGAVIHTALSIKLQLEAVRHLCTVQYSTHV